MRFSVLGSGSRGNSTLVESGKTRILIDAGFPGREIQRRLARVGCTLESLDAILVTHEHHDHVAGVGVLARRLGLAVHANPATCCAAEARWKKIPLCREFDTGESFYIKDFHVHPFQISHDTADPVGFTLSDGSVTLGCCTDTGRITRLIAHRLAACRAVILEANHDPQMLLDGPYPLPLKQRIKSSQGHLTNRDAGRFLKDLAAGGLRQAVLAHLSDTNNLPGLAMETVLEELGEATADLKLHLASQEEPTGFFTV